MIENLPKTYEELSARLEKQRQQDTKPDIHSFLSDTSFLPKQGKALSSTAQTAPRAGRYDMLSSGRVIPKFESYTTGYNEEERLAQQQGTGEKWVRGAGKFFGKTGLNIADATAGTLNGLKEAIVQKRFSAFYDNDFSKYLDDQRTRLENNLVNYYTQEERSKNFLQRMGTANFWANDFGDAMAFLAGAALPEAVYATLTGGASLSVGATKLGLRASASALKKKTAKELLEQVGKGVTGKADDYLRFREGNSAIRKRYRDLLLQKTGDAAALAGFTIRTSAFEAGMEARHNLKEAMDSYMQYFQQENGRQPTEEELSEFTDKALNAANGVFLGNLALLSVSNRVMFGKLAGLEIKSLGRNSLLNRSLGLGFDIEKGVAVAQKANKLQRLAGNAYQILRKPVSEGLFEEGLQGVAGKTMQKYLEATYDPNKLYSEGIMASLLESINEQYTTKEGWDEILMGMLVGSLGGGLISPATSLASGQGVKFDTIIAGTFADSYGARVKERNTAIEKANKFATEKTAERLGGRNLVREAARASSMMEDGQMSGAETRRMNFNYIMSQKELMDFSEMQQGFEALVDANPLTVQQKEELEKQGITEEQYKATLKETFKEDLASVKKAERLVDSVNIQDIQTSKGNKIALREAIMWNIVAGRDSHKNAMTAARLIEQTTKQDGVADILGFYAGLEEEGKQKIEERKEKIAARDKARQEAVDAQNEIARTQAQSKGQQEIPFAKEAYRDASERYAVAVQTSMRLEQEIAEIDQLLESQKRTQDVSFLDFTNENTFFTMDQVSEQIDKLDEYVSTLRRRGQNKEADTLEELMRDFAINTNLYKEFSDSHRMMVESDFFASEQGRGLLGRIFGRAYSMPQELADAINEQNERFEPTLRRFGLVEGRAGDAIKALMDNSTELSDREKFRAENALRLTLNMVEYDNMVEDYRKFVDTMGEDVNVDQEGGDTTTKAAKRNKTIGELEAIDEAIQQITEQIDYLRSLSNKERTAQIEEQISQLQSEINALKEQASKKTTPVTKTTTDPITGEVTDVVEVDVPNEQQNEETNEQEVLEDTQDAGDENQRRQSGEQLRTEEDSTEEITQKENELRELQEELSLAKGEITVLESEDFVRYDELLKEQQKSPATFPTEKQRELNNLKEKVDRWIFASGLQTDGVLLSELLEQKAVLEATVINAPEDITPISEQEIIEDNDVMPDKKKNANTHLGYFYDGVTVTLSSDETQAEINGIKESSLRENLILLDEESGEIRPITSDDIGGLDITMTETENGNIVVPLDVLQAISSLPNSLISFNFIGESIGRNYSPVVIYETDMEGNLRGSYMPVSQDFQDFNSPNLAEAVYETEVGDQPRLVVDTSDSYNKNLIDNYKKALDDVKSENETTPPKQAKKLGELYAQRKAVEDKKRKTAKDKALLEDIDKKVQEVVDEIEKSREKSKARARLEEAKQDLQQNLRITAIKSAEVDGGIATIATLRGRGQYVHDKEIDRKFQSWREQEIGKEEFLDALLAERIVEIPTGPMTVDKIYPGIPNFVFQKTADGRQVVTYVPFTQNQAEKIVDIGYKEGGTMKTRNKTKGLDTTFLKKFSEQGKQRTPFVVIQQGKKLIAYPVRVGQLSKPDTKDLVDLFNSQRDPIEKAIALNKLIAQKGLDVKQPGNAFFVGTGGIGNLTQENLDNIISKINSIEYLYPLNEWVSSNVPIADILTQQALINVKMSSPFHSPKVSFDTEAYFKNTEVTVSESTNKKKSKEAEATMAQRVAAIAKGFAANEEC